MKFRELLEIVGDGPIFTSALLKVGDVNPVDIASQLSRWVASGRIIRLRRGVYTLGDAYRKRDPHPYEVANQLVAPSYVSLESALSFHGLIPEAVFGTTSVTTARAGVFDNELGRFLYQHITPEMMWGYRAVELGSGGKGNALVATPEKALLDMVYLRPKGDTEAFLRELRLESLDVLDLEALGSGAQRTGKPKLLRAAAVIGHLANEIPDRVSYA